MTNAQNAGEAVYQLRKALVHFGRSLRATHPWFLEADRWKELVVALLLRATGLPEGKVRVLTDAMAELGFLDTAALSALMAEDRAPLGRRIRELMVEAGAEPDRADRGLTTMIEAASGLQLRDDGKIQRYLRRYGEQMLDELDNTFKFSELTRKEAKDAFTYWLQNALSMPLSLMDEATGAFCARHGITPAELRDAADSIGVSLSYVDDLARLSMAPATPPRPETRQQRAESSDS